MTGYSVLVRRGVVLDFPVADVRRVLAGKPGGAANGGRSLTGVKRGVDRGEERRPGTAQFVADAVNFRTRLRDLGQRAGFVAHGTIIAYSQREVSSRSVLTPGVYNARMLSVFAMPVISELTEEREMPVYLSQPRHDGRGPDGQGWNRLSLNAGPTVDQCALKPSSYATLWESQNTTRARFGSFGPCTREGACSDCPVLAEALNPEPFRAFTDSVLVRVLSRPSRVGVFGTDTRVPHLMNKPEQGWGSTSFPTTWQRLAQIIGHGWTLGRRHVDQDSPGGANGEAFWLHKQHPETHDGRP